MKMALPAERNKPLKEVRDSACLHSINDIHPEDSGESNHVHMALLESLPGYKVSMTEETRE
jgi:hypothetical protein